MSLGKAAKSPSILDLVISTNCLERRALPDLVQTAEANKTIFFFLQEVVDSAR